MSRKQFTLLELLILTVLSKVFYAAVSAIHICHTELCKNGWASYSLVLTKTKSK